MESHPSYGNLMLYRRNSSGSKVLFGSAARHNTTVVIRISTAKMRRCIHSNTYYADKNLVELELSLAQFSQFIMSTGQGEGTPCTLRHIGGKAIEECPRYEPREVYENEIAKSLQELKDLSASLESLTKTLLEKQRLTVDEKQRLKSAVGNIATTVNSNLEFIMKSFQEEMDAAVTAAKIEVENFQQTLVSNRALPETED